MFFLMRTAFWLTLVLMLIPLVSSKDTEPRDSIDPVAAYFAAQAAVSDMGGFCERNPAACETGGEALAALGAQARDGARIVYEFLDNKVADADQPDLAASNMPATQLPAPGALASQPDAALVTGSTQATAGTLTDQDKALPWQGLPEIVSQAETPVGPVPRSKPRASERT